MRPRASAEKSPGSHEWSTERGSLKVEVRSPKVIVLTASGHLDATLGKHLVSTIVTHIRERPLHLFIDVEDLSDYVPDVRVNATRAIQENRANLLSLHVLARSKIVRMGVAVAALAIRSLVAHDKRSSFSAALNAALSDR